MSFAREVCRASRCGTAARAIRVGATRTHLDGNGGTALAWNDAVRPRKTDIERLNDELDAPRPSSPETTGVRTTPDQQPRLRWLIPIDEHAEERAALEFGKWLHADNDAHAFEAVYVPTTGGMPVEAVAEAAKARALAAGADAVVERFIEAQELQLPTEVLWEVDRRSHTGVVLARRADAQDDAMVRLGGLTRHVALHASALVAVVPHDFEARAKGERRGPGLGPVLLAVDPAETPGTALTVARRIARSKERELELGFVPVDGSADAAALEAWTEAHGAGDVPARIGRGEVAPTLREMARRIDAALIVAGTGQRSVVSRALRPSVALDLCRFADRPVLLVPRQAGDAPEA